MSEHRFDYIIIGAGTAGCLLANRLSADASKRVLLIEAGRKDDYHWVHIPVGYLYCIGNPRTDWLFTTEPDAGLNGRSLRYPRGRVLGGCSSINGMIYMRGQARDYDQWAQLTGDSAWTWDNALPHFKLHEDHYKGADALHGARGVAPELMQDKTNPYQKILRHRNAGGEWRVEKQRLRWDILDAFAEAASQAGIPATPDFNRGSNEGVGYFEVNQKNGWRWNTAKAFLRPTCLGRPNFELWTNAQVSKLVIEPQPDGSQRCTGAEVWTGQERVTALATRDSGHMGEVLLCAGSIGSPHLLQLSGIGPAGLLRQHGIAVVQDLPGVGANLQDHLQIRSVYKIQGEQGRRRWGLSLNTMADSLWGKARIGLEYALRRTGPMSMAPSQLGAFTRSSPDQPYPNIEYHVQPLSLDAFGEPLHRFNAFTASVCNLNPTSRGSVRLKTGRFEDAPAIAPNYLSTPEDRQVAADSLRITRKIVSQGALAKYQPEEFKPGVQFQTDEDLARLAGDIATTIFHPVGTTKMGRADDPMAVVDSHLRVRGVRGLRVVDAGVMPLITSGNTNSPTLMIAEKAAQWIQGGV
ncbi:GMC family oxidoreductase [Polaromonas naphthalenivorans]|uniref:Glucose-methanol-choline oxidoreductase n=1 Tax=Polaromonas naphthalenivorans (strain CJ2) TaxID=365044 RepID=A1VIM7_POLNA|nr:GMC family oxidoreductase N-terminal domain-containing protein [Polaromonas naphthalenivorans]ABM35505.1 glucose-methanol-choline oxidoreductase [Polaromonas naphthalenivorans CJ2]